MFEFLRALIPGRKSDASKTASAAKSSSTAASRAGKLPVGKVVTDRPVFGQKPKAVYKPARHTKPRAKR
jgi:hypothetical protein